MKVYNFLVVGDSCTDTFIYGDCRRMCPEAPVPVFKEKFVKQNGGMAKNVYSNMVSIVGDEPHIVALLTNTTNITKTRYIDEHTNHMIVRIDSDESNLDKLDVNGINFENYDCVVISDYNKGFISAEDIEYISKKCPLTFLDTKKQFGNWIKDVRFIKINRHEYDINKSYIQENLNLLHDKLIITYGKDGCYYKNNEYDVNDVQVKDLSGAGDTFLAALSIKFIQTGDIIESIKFANKCSTQVVQKRGVVTVNMDEL